MCICIYSLPMCSYASADFSFCCGPNYSLVILVSVINVIQKVFKKILNAFKHIDRLKDVVYITFMRMIYIPSLGPISAPTKKITFGL